MATTIFNNVLRRMHGKRASFNKIMSYLVLGLEICDTRILISIKSIYDYYEFANNIYYETMMCRLNVKTLPYDKLMLSDAVEICIMDVSGNQHLAGSVPTMILKTPEYWRAMINNPILIPPKYVPLATLLGLFVVAVTGTKYK